jgi:SPP1 gp7 family putative phage head morphogenesis protein
MKNNEILNNRWKEIDKKLSIFNAKRKRIDEKLFDDLQSSLDSIKFTYDDLYNYANTIDINRLHSKIRGVKETGELKGFIGYKLNYYLNHKRLRNNDLLMAMLMLAYYNQYNSQKEIENELFEEVSNLVSKQARAEVLDVLPKKKRKRVRLVTVPELFTLQLLAMPFYNGYSWNDFKEANITYNINQLYKKIKVEMQQGKELNVYKEPLKKEVDKQNRAYLSEREKKRIYDDAYIGYLDNAVVYIANQVALKTYESMGIEQVIFIAIEDEKTTKMCDTLNGQIFNINGANIFQRYSSADDRIVTYETKGLEIGANLPPIDNHYHHCRSTIYPYVS